MYQEEENKTISPIIIIITGIIAAVLIFIFFKEVVEEYKRKNAYIDNLDITYVGNPEEWQKCKTISVNNFESNIKEYSFDNGENWQESNLYEVCQNGLINVLVRNGRGKEVGKGSINVSGIDIISPTIITSDITIKVGEKINLLADVEVVDNESGVLGSVTYSPKFIDTSKEGIYTITYKVYDKAGNSSTKLRVITVEK